MKLVIKSVLIAWIASFSGPAFSQCEDVLKDGVMQATTFRSSNYFELAVYSRFSKMSYNQAKTKQMVGLSVPIGRYVMGKANFTKNEFAAKRSQIEKIFSAQTRASSTVDFGKVSGDSEILSAWSQCMAKTGPFLSILFERPTVKDASMLLEWHAGKTTLHSTKLKSNIDVGNAKVLQGQECLRRGKVISNGSPCIVRLRLPKAETSVLVSASSSNGAATAFLPPKMRIQRETSGFELLKGKCLNSPASSRRARAKWPAQCPARLRGSAKRQSLDYEYAVYLPEDLQAEGWNFDMHTAQFNVLRHRGKGKNRCVKKGKNVSPYQFNYSYKAIGEGDKNVTVVCSAYPSIHLERYVLVADN